MTREIKEVSEHFTIFTAVRYQMETKPGTYTKYSETHASTAAATNKRRHT